MSVLDPIWTPPPAEKIKVRGWKNKVELDETRRSRSPRPRHRAVKAFLKSWATGETSSVGIWRLAYAIVRADGTDAGFGMSRLAALATETSGSTINCSRRLKQLLAETALPKMIREVPHRKGERTITHLLRPTDLIRLIHGRNRRKFSQIFGAGRTALKSFWTSLFASEDGREFKALPPSLRAKDPEELQPSIPIVVHEDAAPYGKKRSVNVVQWGPLLIKGSDIESRFIHHGYISKQGDPAETARRAWGKFWEEVDQMAEGVDQDGIPFARDDDGTVWKFEFTFCEQDFDMDAEHGLPCNKRALLFCKHCRATNSTVRGQNPHPYNDNTPSASWRNHRVTCNTEFMQRIVRRHPMTDSKYFNRYTSRNDLMHAMDHHGVYGVIFASIVVYVVWNDGVPSLGATQQQRLDTVNGRLCSFYDEETEVSSQLDTLTMKNLLPAGTADYAALGGPTVKAANTRQAMPFLRGLADRYLTNPLNMDHVLIHQLIRHTLEFNRLVYSSGTFFTDDELIAFRTATEGIGKYMQLLRSRAKQKKQLLWHIVPKTHYMQHFPDEARLISPRVVQCYIEESYIGKIAAIWTSSKCGPYSETIQFLALLKYLVWVVIELDL